MQETLGLVNMVKPTPSLESDWISLVDAAKKMKKDISGFRQLIKRHTEVHEFLDRKKFDGRMKICIHMKGLTILMNTKDTMGANQHSSREDASLLERDSKKKVAIAAIESKIESTQDPWLTSLEVMAEMRRDQLKSMEKIGDLEDKTQKMSLEVAKINEEFDSMEPLDIKDSQRKHLVDRARNLAAKAEIPYNIVFGNLNKAVGKKHVEDYSFSDYAKAMKVLKKTYDQYRLSWA